MSRYFEDYLNRLNAFHEQIKRDLNGLPDAAADWVAEPEMNSLAVLVAHSMGSESYWIGQMAAGLDVGRVRDEEFAAENLSIAALVAMIDKATTAAEGWLAELTLADLERMVTSTPHEREFSIGWSLLHALDHTAEHAGHVGITKQLWENQSVIYIVGVDHQIQHINHSAASEKEKSVDRFMVFLKDSIHANDISLVAEEFSQQALKNSDADESILERVSIELGISHQFCDPDSEQRKNNSIDDNDKREQYWLRVLNIENHQNILFVCGDEHVVSFSGLLSDKNIGNKILGKGWGKELS